MYTSDSIERRDKRALIAYVGIGAFCALFSFIYAQFSHGVSSVFMTYMCLIPLIGGAGVLAIQRFTHAPAFSRFSFNAYNSGIATLTIASILRGVFDIAGTASPYLIVFLVVGVVCLFMAAFGTAVDDKGKPRDAQPSRKDSHRAVEK